MAAQSVDEVHITNWVDTGLTSPLSRFTMNVRVKWTDSAGVKQDSGVVAHTFPNDLSVMPLAARRFFANQMIMATVRVALGIDQWADYQ